MSATAGAALVAAMFALPGAGVAYASDNGNTTGNGNVSVLSGNSITTPVSVPVNVCGNAVAAAAFANANCKGGSTSCIGSNCNTPCTHNCTPPCRHNLPHPAAGLHGQLRRHPARRHRPRHHHGEHRDVACWPARLPALTCSCSASRPSTPSASARVPSPSPGAAGTARSK